MELQYYGGNCIKVITKKATVVIDDNIKELGGSDVAKPSDIQLFTTRLTGSSPKGSLIIDGPGEYEASNVSISGVAARAHVDETDMKNATIYKIVADNIRLAIIGHVYPDLKEAQLEAIGIVDVLIVPVGGHGFTLDTVGALKVIKQIEPKIIIPTQYEVKGLAYPVPAISLEESLKGLVMEPKDIVSKLKLKSSDMLSEQMQLIVLEKQK
jgi:L-ascorbate metabolism protein UlaG (beta-lactamase superfamily)